MDSKAKIQELVDTLGSPEAVAFRLNISSQSIWKWLNEGVKPHRSNRIQIDRLHKRICGKKLINQSPIGE